ncbi:MAG: hypothetical protein ACRC42_01630, partial [Mycoplasma sp.]
EAIPVNGQDITIEYVNVENNTESNDTGTCELATGSDNLGCTMNNLGTSSINGNKSTRAAKWFWTKSGTYKIKEIEGKDNDDTDYIYTPNTDAAGHTITLKSIWDDTITTTQEVNYAKNESSFVITYTHLEAVLPVVKIQVGGNLKDTQCTRDGSTLKVNCTFNKGDVPTSDDWYTVKVFNKCDQNANDAKFKWKVIEKNDITKVIYDNDNNKTTKCKTTLGDETITIEYLAITGADSTSETTGSCKLKETSNKNNGCTVSDVGRPQNSWAKLSRSVTLTLSEAGTYYLEKINGAKEGAPYSYNTVAPALDHTIQVKSILDSNDSTAQVVDYRKTKKSFTVPFTSLDPKDKPDVKIVVKGNNKNTSCSISGGKTSVLECTFIPGEVPISVGYNILVFNKCDSTISTPASFKLKVIDTIKKDITKVAYGSALTDNTSICLDAIPVGGQDITIGYENVEDNDEVNDTGTCVLVGDGPDNAGCTFQSISTGTQITGTSYRRSAKWVLSQSGIYKIKEIKGQFTGEKEGSDYSYTPNADAAGHTITLKSIWDNSITTTQEVNYAKNESSFVITYTHLEAVLPVVKIQVGDNSKDTQCTRDGSTLKVKCTFNKED